MPDESSASTTSPPLLSDAMRRLFERIKRRGRSELHRAAATSRNKLELRQLNKDLDHFWVRLGKTSYHLVQGGELDHPALRKAMARIDELEAKIDTLKAGELDPDAEGSSVSLATGESAD